MIDEYTGREHWGKRLDCERPGVITTPQQLLTGLAVGLANLRALCNGCGEAVGEGALLTVYAYRCPETPDWETSRCYCEACGPDRIETPTLGATEALVRTRLGVIALPDERAHRLCLTGVELLAVSRPTEGSEP